MRENRDDDQYYEIDYSPYLVFEQRLVAAMCSWEFIHFLITSFAFAVFGDACFDLVFTSSFILLHLLLSVCVFSVHMHAHTHTPHTHSYSSAADDVVEHLKLNGSIAVQHSSQPKGSSTTLQEGKEEEGEGEGEGEGSVLQVKELLKTEREQRVSQGRLGYVGHPELLQLYSQISITFPSWVSLKVNV